MSYVLKWIKLVWELFGKDWLDWVFQNGWEYIEEY
jgi:hypothetical protein